MLQAPDKPPQKPAVKKAGEPLKKTIDPGVFLAGTLDDISRKLSELLILNGSVEKLNKSILKELTDEADEGEYMFVQGTATTDTSQNITDLLGMMGHPVKGYIIKNDGGNTLEVGHNITPSSIDSTVQTASARFYPLFAGEQHKEMFNKKVIRNVYLRTAAGTASYRLWLLW